MPSALTSGYNLDVKDSAGGIKEVYFIEQDNISAIAETAGVVTTMTKVTAKRWWKYELHKQTAVYEETVMGSEENGTIAYEQSLTFSINKMASAVRNELILLAKNRLLCVFKDNNGVFWLMGKDGSVHISTGKYGTGTKLVDRNGYEITVTGMEKEPAVEVNSTIATALETPGS